MKVTIHNVLNKTDEEAATTCVRFHCKGGVILEVRPAPHSDGIQVMNIGGHGRHAIGVEPCVSNVIRVFPKVPVK